MKRLIILFLFFVFFVNVNDVNSQSDTVIFNGTISELTINTGMNKGVLDLSNYFSSNNTVTYKYKAGVDGIEGLVIEIGSDGKVNIEASTPGSRSAVFIADDDITAAESNDARIKISGEAVTAMSFSPNTDAVSITENEEQVFAVSGNESAEWYLDDVKLNHTSNTYNFLGDGVGVHTIRVVSGSSSKTWTVSVLAESIANPAVPVTIPAGEPDNQVPVCGNNIKESGEDCSSCPSDVKCSANTRCENSVCVPVKQYGKLVLWLVLLAAVIVFLVMGVILLRKKGIGPGFLEKFKNLFRRDKNGKGEKREIRTGEEKTEKIEDAGLNPLVAYFKNNLGRYDKEALMNQAAQQGWTEDQIRKAINMIDSVDSIDSGGGDDKSGSYKVLVEKKP